MATISSILVWKIPWTEEPGGYRPWNCKESDTAEELNRHTLLIDIKENVNTCKKCAFISFLP